MDNIKIGSIRVICKDRKGKYGFWSLKWKSYLIRDKFKVLCFLLIKEIEKNIRGYRVVFFWEKEGCSFGSFFGFVLFFRGYIFFFDIIY